MTQTCATCRFWRPTEGDFGQCRRRAPTTLYTTQTTSVRPDAPFRCRAVWPETRAEEWCGDYQPQPVSQKIEPPPPAPPRPEDLEAEVNGVRSL